MFNIVTIHRRTFLAGSAGAVAAAGLVGSGATHAQEAKSLPEYVDWKNPDALIVHSGNTLETKRGYIGTSGITATDELYIRNCPASAPMSGFPKACPTRSGRS